MSDTVPKEKQTELEQEATRLTTKAQAFEVIDDSSYRTAISGIDQAKEFQKAVKEVWDPVCDAANKAHKTATAGRKAQLEPFTKVEAILKQLCELYDREQDRLRREAQKKIDDEKAQKEADALAKAEALEAEGKTEEAEAVVEEAVQEDLFPEPLPPDPPKGIVYIDNWKAEIVEPNLVPRQYCVPSQQQLDKHAKANRDSIPIPGVVFVNNRTVRR